MKQTRAIAIDGPAGAGKSTMARSLAQQLGYHYVDTGAFYRTLSLACREKGLDSRDSAGILALLKSVSVDVRFDDEAVQHMLLQGRDVTGEIRTGEISAYTSDISVLPEVREKVNVLLREMARQYDVIMDGRDIGTVVLPEADVKIFLTASAEERARRRVRQLEQAGHTGADIDYEEILAGIRYRDEQDSTRQTAPLRPAEDAVIVSTDEMDEAGTLAYLAQLINN